MSNGIDGRLGALGVLTKFFDRALGGRGSGRMHFDTLALSVHTTHGFTDIVLDAANQTVDLLGGLRSFLRQLANFFGNDCETMPLFACP